MKSQFWSDWRKYLAFTGAAFLLLCGILLVCVSCGFRLYAEYETVRWGLVGDPAWTMIEKFTPYAMLFAGGMVPITFAAGIPQNPPEFFKGICGAVQLGVVLFCVTVCLGLLDYAHAATGNGAAFWVETARRMLALGG